jgi:hypothetical protein
MANIIAEARAFLVGVAGRHALPGIITEQPAKRLDSAAFPLVVRSTRFSASRSCTFRQRWEHCSLWPVESWL